MAAKPTYEALEQRVNTLELEAALLRQSEHKLNSHLQNTPIGAISWDLNFRAVEWNPAAETIFGYSKEEAKGKHVTELILPAEIKEEIDDVFQDLISEKGGTRSTNDNVTKDGKRVVCDWYNTTLKDADGKVVGVASLVHDITSRKQAEAALQASEKEYRSTLNDLLVGVVVHARDTSILFSNTEASNILGLTYEQLSGKQAIDPSWNFVHEDSTIMEVEDYPVSKVFSTETPLYDYIVGINRPDKDYVIWVIVNASPVFSNENNLDKVIVNFADITATKRAEEALEQRILALTIPLDSPEHINFEDLFNIDDIQRLQDEFASATGVASIITHTDGTPITRPSNFSRLCNEIIRKTEKGLANCYKSDAVIGRLSDKGPIIQQCLSGGLWDAGAGISVGGKHIANWLIGQVRDETQTADEMRTYAREIGANENDFIEAFNEVSSMSREQFESVAQALFTFANQISTSAYQNIQQARFITNRKKAEKELRESEKKHKTLVNNIPGMVYRAFPDWSIEISSGLENISGYTVSELNAKENHWLSLVHPDDLEQVLKEGTQLSTKQGNITQQYRIISKEGFTRWVEDHKTALFSNVGEFLGVDGVVLDITERKDAEKQRYNLESQLRQAHKNEAIGTMAGGIAHDFNNILAAIIGYADMAKGDIPDFSPAKHQIEQVLKAGNRAKDLVRHILTFSRMSSFPQGHVHVNLSSLVKEVVKFQRSTIPTTIEIISDIDENCGQITGDPTQLHQVIMNLCTNASHAMDEENGTLEISLKKTEVDLHPGTYIQLSVSDTGTGLSPELIDKIFDPYFTTKAVGKGSGMGLAIVQSIVKNHGGFIKVESKVGKGSTFLVFFPRLKKDLLVEDNEKVAEIPTGTEKILFVDDEEMLADIGKIFLERLGYSVTSVTDSGEALELFLDNPSFFDLVITDQAMPQFSGTDLAKQFLQIRPDVPIILCTGYSSMTNEEKARSIGIRGYVMKPIDNSAISGLIRELLDGREPIR